MSNVQWLVRLAPEITLLVGACLVLLVGVLGFTRRARLEAQLTLALQHDALWISIRQGEKDGRTAKLGLCLT